MTTEEHKLMVGMFTTQLGIYNDLLNVLRDKGIIRSAELSALWKAAHDADPTKAAALASSVRVLYVAQAKLVGLDVDLPEPPA